MADSIHWLDFSDQHSKDLLKALHDLNNQQTVDELGLGRIRDYYSDLFFPGLTSLMTKARYFMFIPAMYSFFEQQKKQISREEIISKQKQLRSILKKNEHDPVGIIGRRKEDIMRWPDDIYWGGLVRLKIFIRDTSGYYYIKSIGKEGKPLYDNDKNVIAEYRYKPGWDFPYAEMRKLYFTSTGTWQDNINFSLTKAEGFFLKNKIVTITDKAESIFSYLLKRERKCNEEMFWLIPVISKRKEVEEARKFSIFAKGLWLSYYFLLEKAKSKTAAADSIRDIFVKWRDRNIAELRHWDFGAYLRNLRQMPCSNKDVIDQRDYDFLAGTYKNIIRKRTGVAVLADNRQLISDRESKKKGSLAKLSNKLLLKDWEIEIDDLLKPDYQYDYLWKKPAREILNEIIIGLRKNV